MPKYREYQSVFRINKRQPTKRTGKAEADLQTTTPRGPSKSRTTQNHGDTDGPSSAAVLNGRGGRHDESKIPEAQARLERLESLVASLVESNERSLPKETHLTTPSHESRTDAASSITLPPAINPPASRGDVPSLQPDPSHHGHLDITGSETQYLGATHWTTILESIKEIQDCLAPSLDQVEDEAENESLAGVDSAQDIVFPHARPLTLSEVCQSLPPRPEVDGLLSVNFNTKYIPIPFIHKRKFLREYESFWRDPSSVPFLWISMLFSTLHLGCRISQSNQQLGFQTQSDTRAQWYLTKAYQALISGQYQKAKPYSVEAVLLYAICKLFQTQDSGTEPWMLIGASARVALKMGYHRDPRHLSRISPFEGEMRRRTFSVVQTLDLLLSFQAGLPATFHEESCDTEPPRNLFDDDFDESCTELPPSRPPTDPTPMLYYCYKGRLAEIFRKVARLALSLNSPSYDTVLQLDNELRQVHAEAPPSIAWKPLGASVMDETNLIMSRLNTALLYQKSLMILHRNYLSGDRRNAASAYSRKACVAASLQTLQYQVEVHSATQPGGQLYNGHWTSSGIAIHDFLLAATITCLDLYELYRQKSSRGLSEAESEDMIREYDALKVAHDIWSSQRSTSRDARRASSYLAVMFSKIPRPHTDTIPCEQGVSRPWPHGPLSLSRPGFESNGTTATDPPVTLDDATSTTDPAPFFDNTDPLLGYDLDGGSSLDGIFGDSEVDHVVDWGVLDQIIFNRDCGEEFNL